MSDMFDYIRLSKRAADLIYKFGDACQVLTYTDVPNSNPAKPPVRSVQEYPTRGVFLKYKAEDIDGTRVLSKDQMVLLSARVEDMPPEGAVEGDHEVVRGSESWKMINVSILKPGPVTMLYKVQVRR